SAASSRPRSSGGRTSSSSAPRPPAAPTPSWPSRARTTSSATATSSTSSSTSESLELRRHGHERHLVVRLAQAARQGAHEGPEQVVGEVAVDEQEVLEVFLADDEQPARLVGARVGAPREVVDEGHLAEVRAGAQDGQRLLAHAG